MTGVVNVEPVPTTFDAVLVQTIVEFPEAPEADNVTDEFPQVVAPTTANVSFTGQDGGVCWTVTLSIEMSPVKDVPRYPAKRILTEAAVGIGTMRSSHAAEVEVCCWPTIESIATQAVPL